MLNYRDAIEWQGNPGLFRSFYKNTQSEIEVRRVSLFVPTKDLEEVPNVYNMSESEHLLTDGYKLSRIPFPIPTNKQNSYFGMTQCMQYPKAFRKPLKSWYFYGSARGEILDFISTFNSMYTFAKLTIHEKLMLRHIRTAGRLTNGYDFRTREIFPPEEGNWYKIVIKLTVRDRNRYVAKFLCVLLRTYFAYQRYDRAVLQNQLTLENPIEDLQVVLNARGGTYLYFGCLVDLIQAFDILEEFNSTDLRAAIGSQTNIYKEIIARRKD